MSNNETLVPDDLDIMVRRLVLANRELFERVGKVLDEAYTPDYFINHPIGQISGESKRATLARTDERIGKIVDELLDYFEIRGRTIPSVTEAEKVILLHWILTDQGCNQEHFQATVLQDWSHGTIRHSLAHAGAASYIANQTYWNEYAAKALEVVCNQNEETNRKQPAGGGKAAKAGKARKAIKAEVEKEFAAQILNPEQRDRLAAMSDRDLADHFNTWPNTVRNTAAFKTLQQFRGPAHRGLTIAHPGAEYVTAADERAQKGYLRKRETR